VLNENNRLKYENKFLKDTLRELQANIFQLGRENAQQIWHSSIDKQLEVNKEIAKNCFELFRMLKVGIE
jgi:hypothetical protein